jgi:DNA-binding winged helix-turn-helix (wHTH) protein/TolB-like protein/Flp pilus assembly protein TadD
VNLTDHPEQTIYRFDGFTVDAKDFVVEKNGEAVILTPRAFDVLQLLLTNAGHVVEKRQMFDEVWKESFVTDNALTKIIKELRHALGDSADEPRYIETVPKRGYRFIGKLEDMPDVAGAETSGAGAWALYPVPSTPARSKVMFVAAAVVLVVLTAAGWIAYTRFARANDSLSTIAVLPFKPLDANSRDESLEFGMAETLITRLSNLRNIVVRPIGSVRKFTDPSHDPVKAGEELQTDVVLDGSIQKSGDRVRVTTRLIDVRSGSTLWSEQFDENFTDIFRVQDSIAERIAGALALKLSRQEQEQLAKHITDDPEAYALYLHGQFLWHRRGPDWINQSLIAYKQALEKDANFALAHIGVADANIMLSGHRRISMEEAEANAAPAIARALEIDNNLAQAHNALAELKYQYQYDWAGAEVEFKTAIDLNPNVAWIRQAYGWFLMSDGRFDEADVQIEKARQLDPSSLTLSAARGRLYFYSRQYDRAAKHFQDLIAQEPNDLSLHLALFTIYQQQKRYDDAINEFLAVETLSGAQAEHSEELRAIYNSSGWEGFQRKRLSELDHWAEESGHGQPWPYITVFAELKDKEKVFYWLDRAAESHDVAMLQLKVEPSYDFIRDDPRYVELLRRIGQKP